MTRFMRHACRLPGCSSSPGPGCRWWLCSAGFSHSKKAWFRRLVQSHITKLILPPPIQLEFAIDRLRLPAAKVVDILWSVDEQFWRSPPDVIPDTICSAGQEMRDYETLIEALDGTGIQCHIAGPLVRGK